MSGRGVPAVAAFAAAARARTRRGGTSLLALFLLPVAVFSVIGLAMGGYADPSFVVGVLDRAGSPASRRLVERIEANASLRARRYHELAALESAVFRGRVVAGVEIPPRFDPGAGPELALFVSESTPGAPAARALLEGELAELAGEAAGRPARAVVDVEPIGAPRLAALPTGFQYTAPANTVLFLLIHGIAASLIVIELRGRGIAKRLLATPARTGELIAALALAPAQAMALQAIFLIGLTGGVFGVSWGDPLGVALVTAAWICFGMATALCMGTVFRTPEQCLSLGPLLGILVGMLGGCMWPLSVVPPPLQILSRLLPTTWALEAYFDLGFLGAAAWDVLPAVALLLAMSLAVGGIGVARLRQRLAH